jgi:hypothetical protein
MPQPSDSGDEEFSLRINNFGPTNIVDDAWHHVVFVIDRNVASYFYIDGTLRHTDITPFSSTDITNGEALEELPMPSST